MRVIEHGDAPSGATRQVDVLDADAIRAHDKQFRSRLEDGLGDFCLGPDAEDADVPEYLKEYALIRASRQGPDFVAGARKRCDRIFMHALEEQSFHPHLVPS